jgi:hypothetical protein
MILMKLEPQHLVKPATDSTGSNVGFSICRSTFYDLVSLNKEDFTDKVNSKRPSIESYHVSQFPY